MKKIFLLLPIFLTSCTSCIVSDLARIREIEAQFPNHRVTVNHDSHNSSQYLAIDTLHKGVPVKKIEFFTNSDKISSVQNL